MLGYGWVGYICMSQTQLFADESCTREHSWTVKILPNKIPLECLHQPEMIGIIEPLEYNVQHNYMKSSKRRLVYFHTKIHNPPVNWTHYMNINLIEGYNFSYCQSMHNIQVIIDTGGCNKYTIKYIGKIYTQNDVIVCTNSHKNGKLVTKINFVHNSKLYASK